MSSQTKSTPLSIYIHFPFCKKRCAYCDFVTFAGRDNLIPGYVEALIREIDKQTQEDCLKEVHTIYLGGGTPSLLNPEAWKDILKHIYSGFDVHPDAEVTQEINPGTVEKEYMKRIRELGINRISVGMQSALDPELKTLGRIHNFEQFCEIVNWMQAAGFDNYSFDLIYGIPGQSLRSWEYSLRKSLEFKPPHLSLYSLTIEEGTPFAKMVQEGTIQPPDDDRLADMVELAMDLLEKHGFNQYEISNWAIKGTDGMLRSSRHNLQYWRNLPYLGMGPGAHGCISGKRIATTTDIQDYIQRSRMENHPEFPISFATESIQSISRDEEMKETMMLGLRLTEEGVSELEFRNRFGIDLQERFGREIEKLISQELLEKLPDTRRTIRLTRRGRLLGNQVFMQFVGD
jgi:oxygen-independent coproporphyrinogen III oxidase